jgi:3-aminobutyryl-CoA ammonia-lyase
MELMGDAATELCIRSDGDEGLFAGYSSVEFLAPVHAGDFLAVRAEIVHTGRTSREMSFSIFRYARRRPEISDSAADVLDEPELVGRATGTCVVPAGRRRRVRGE